MNSEQLLGHYERMAEAPDAISRLRRFVLDLAVRGKLVEQDTRDAPASELVQQIAGEKNRLYKAGVIRKPKVTTPLTPDELPFQLPSGWAWSQIGELGLISPRNDAPDETIASFVPMPMISADYGIENQHEARQWREIKKGYTHFAEGDVGLAKITPCFENGKSTVFRNLTGGFGSGTTELHVLRPLLVSGDYVVLFLKSPQFIETGISRMTGTAGQKRVSTEYFTSSPFPLPPLAEQHRIVAKVDELMALCDRLEEARKEREAARDRLTAASLVRLNAPDPDPATFTNHARFALDNIASLTSRLRQIAQLRATIIELATRGKLSAQDAGDTPPTKALEAISETRDAMLRAKTLRREKPLPAINPDELPFQAPASWVWARLGDVAVFTQYGTSLKAEQTTTGVPVLTMGNIQSGAVVSAKEKRIPSQCSELPELYLQKFDLLYNRTNSPELVGKTGIYLGDDDCVTFASYLIRLRFAVDHTSPQFINLAMNAPGFRISQIAPHIKQQTGQANVNGTAMKSMLIALPPIEEQRRIVAKVDELMALCDQLEASLTTGDETRQRLLEAVLHKALEPAEARELEPA